MLERVIKFSCVHVISPKTCLRAHLVRLKVTMERSVSAPQPSTELSASPETELPLPIEALSAGGVDRPRGAVRTFHDEVLAYFLSQMWYDLIFVHVLRLRPRPFCEWWHLTYVLGQACALALAPTLTSTSALASACLTLPHRRLPGGGHRGGGHTPQACFAKVRRWRADYQVPDTRGRVGRIKCLVGFRPDLAPMHMRCT